MTQAIMWLVGFIGTAGLLVVSFRVVGIFWTMVLIAVTAVGVVVFAFVAHGPWLLKAVYTAILVLAIDSARTHRHNRKGKRAVQRLGYKARALKARLVATMPKARPTGQLRPAPAGGGAA